MAESEADGMRCRGDLHTHTTWSDGGASLAEMTAAAEALGREYIAVTDHSPRLKVARGLSRERLLAQWEEIAEVQRERELRILRGIEVDILSDGGLDQGSDLLAQLDVVVASVHHRLDDDADTMTRRMVAAVANPHTTVLGHCTGRKRRSDGTWRGESRFDAEMVFAACEMFGVAVEINSRPDRADPRPELLELADEIGCLFAINTDSHAPEQLEYLPLGEARAAEAGIHPDRIITTWPVDELLRHANRHR
ncbi:PHP domain-containing protein [Tessaracoccus massiliensis]|uniref:PHP domain-containing protein n=1 Tax=Tessaracoccus massiliensis TaxID=1522311 RepID=UPI00069466AE|nr:PHP domain-containing protein [Tessaracoccus massiliensis]